MTLKLTICLIVPFQRLFAELYWPGNQASQISSHRPWDPSSNYKCRCNLSDNSESFLRVCQWLCRPAYGCLNDVIKKKRFSYWNQELRVENSFNFILTGGELNLVVLSIWKLLFIPKTHSCWPWKRGWDEFEKSLCKSNPFSSICVGFIQQPTARNPTYRVKLGFEVVTWGRWISPRREWLVNCQRCL